MDKQGGGGDSEGKKLNDATCDEIEAIPGVQAVLRMLDTSVKFGSGRYVAWGQLLGINPEAMQYFDFVIDQGRLLDENDTNAIVFGSDVPRNFYNPKDRRSNRWDYSQESEPSVNVLKDRLILTFDMSYGEPQRNPGEGSRRPKRYNVEGVGLLSWEGSMNYSWYAIANIDYVKKIMKENERLQGNRRRNQETVYNQIKVRVEDLGEVVNVQNTIKDMGFQTYSLNDQMEEMQKTSRVIQAVLGGIGAISLLVAALGITNTMVMSIYERTREIGIMKVLGCLLRDIKNMFLIESGLIGFIGGIIGGLFSIGASFLLNKFLAPALMGQMYGVQVDKISIIPPWLLLGVVVFSTFVGLISGYSPARRAMKLSALSAIRTE